MSKIPEFLTQEYAIRKRKRRTVEYVIAIMIAIIGVSVLLTKIIINTKR